MMRAHCDRCDQLLDETRTWVEDPDAPFKPYTNANPTWHLAISAGGSERLDRSRMFCRRCTIFILELFVKELRAVKAPTGGHLADCVWNAFHTRYDCVEGCEIKRINDLVPKGDGDFLV